MVLIVAVVVLNVVPDTSTVVDKDDVTPAARNDAVAESGTMVEVFVTVAGLVAIAEFAGTGTVVVGFGFDYDDLLGIKCLNVSNARK